MYCQVSNTRRTLVGNLIVDHHSDVVGASPVGAAPTTSSFSTEHLVSIYFAKTTASRDKKHLSFGIWCVLYWRFYGMSENRLGWVGLWGFLWWAPSAKGKDHHGVSSGWSSVWHRSNTGLSSTQYEQIPIILGIWPFWLTPFFFRSITFWRAYG